MEIEEISLQRTECHGTCPAYQLTLRRDGAAEFRGYMHVDRLGRHAGRVAPEAFAALARSVVASGFWRRSPGYHYPATDMPTTYVTVRASDQAKEVRNYGFAAPGAHEALEYAIDAVAAQIAWVGVGPVDDDERR